MEELIAAATEWAETAPAVRGLALVGSHARGDATASSDLDLVVVVNDVERWFADTAWLGAFGDVSTTAREDYEPCQSLRVHFDGGAEVEFGFVEESWLDVPVDPGTARVLSDGHRVLYDPDARFARAVGAIEVAESKDRGWMQAAAIDADLEAGRIDRAGWHAAILALIERTGLDYVPRQYRGEYIAHLLAEFVEPGGRLVIGIFNEERADNLLEHEVRSHGYEVAGRVARQHRHPALAYKAFWITSPLLA